jgi:hypothetical protein
MSDLLHLMALFFMILIGYSLAGMLLFGKQFEGFSSMSYSFQTLLFVLLCMDPTQMWKQVFFRSLLMSRLGSSTPLQ